MTIARRKRTQRGSAIAEMGPAMWVLLICIFFPMMNLLSLSVSYGLCVVLNSNQVHEASLLHYNDARLNSGSVKRGIPDQWLSGMGKFVNITGYPSTSINYRSGQTSPGPNPITDKFVKVSTTVICNPFLTIPLPVVNVPGINGPMTFTIAAERPMENPDYAP